jgi:hypothetical protein
MVYHVMIQRGQSAPLTDEAKELFRTEDFEMAKAIADNHRAATGLNCGVESRALVYTTQTLDEAMADDPAGKAPVEAVAIIRGGAHDGKRFRSAQSFARAVDQLAADRRHVQVGDHTPEQRARAYDNRTEVGRVARDGYPG